MTITFQTLWTATCPKGELPALAARVAAELQAVPRFCLWLTAPMGAGKTTFSGALLRHLGLAAYEPVTSPTYTYMNEYQIAGDWYAHLDLYRSRGEISPEELGLSDVRPFRGVLIEWPEQCPEHPVMQPTHVLEIAFSEAPETRLCRLQVPLAP